MFLPGMVKADDKLCEYEDDKININLTINNSKFKIRIDEKEGNFTGQILPQNKLDINYFSETCPTIIYYELSASRDDMSQMDIHNYNLYNTLENDSRRIAINLKSNNSQLPGGNGSGETSENNNPYFDGDINVTLDIKTGCGLFSSDMKDWLIQLLDIIKIVGLVLTAILSMVDFLKGTATGNADTMKKVWKNIGNRLISVVILFLLPVLIEFVLGLVTLNGVEDITNPLCGIK